MKRMNRTCAVIGFIVIGTGAWAQSRQLTTAMACNQAQSLVATQGSVVLNTGATTYDRFVASGAYCGLGEAPGPGWAPTKDVARCLVGSRCVSVARGSGP
ncbi:hypothetical protein [Microvirga sp. CF3016]|uniref:hypothetical protein n=1 Tax=Microvirga sp. CF3016 TaxID=3110181 RepID=UPI002E75D1B8|nr:hypothetical protein [Microvirga sp. CF3016]MEE1613829.1 hypothetical protein [Microvirga sp. CF3016]